MQNLTPMKGGKINDLRSRSCQGKPHDHHQQEKNDGIEMLPAQNLNV